jgi:hypothetical protein
MVKHLFMVERKERGTGNGPGATSVPAMLRRATSSYIQRGELNIIGLNTLALPP